jgi:NAD(P)-dependent dehydrogenase (short-subunit alcohol dehydrogenase family)
VSQVKPTILVTGGAGYIGSHAVLALQKAGYGVVVLDNLSAGHPELIQEGLKAELIVGDTNDRALLDQLFAERAIAAVMHFANQNPKHLLGHLEVCDNAIFKWTDRNNISRCATDHLLGFKTNCKNSAGILIDSNN